MAGNKRAYSGAMKKGSTAAWDRQWAAAIREYRRALVEFPQDPAAHASLALALKESGQLQDAVAEYRLARDLNPRDPAPLGQLAGLEDTLGHREEATSDYLALADIYCGQKQTEKAIEAWRQAVALSPDRADIREKIFAAFKDAGNDRAAAQELVALAQLQRKAGDLVRAHILLQQAVSFDPTNSQAKVILADLVGRPSSRESDARDNPVEKARRSSLSKLAQNVFEEGPRWKRSAPLLSRAPQVDWEGLLAGAIDAQTHGRTDEAIEKYEQIVQAGRGGPEIQFNLALLYKDTIQYEQAIKLLSQTVNEPQFTSASYFAIAECRRAQGNYDQASENFIHAMQSVDVASMDQAQADQVMRIYESLKESYRTRGADADAEKSLQTLSGFLSGKGWEERVRQVRRHLEAVGNSGTSVSYDVLELPDSDKVIESLGLTEEYLREGHLVAATEEAMRAIELAPDYLPAHQKLGEILAQSGRTREAHDKFVACAENAEVRGDISRAMLYCRKALALNPEEDPLRAKLIRLLVSNGQLPEALDEHLDSGLRLERAGQLAQAAETYSEAIRLAERAGAITPAVQEMRQRLADAHLRNRDWQNALYKYREILSSSPQDERARFYVVELLMRLGRQPEALQELDGLLGDNRNALNKTRAILAALARDFPDELGLKIRMARADYAAGQREKAIEELDGLGERLLNAGQREAAIQVIREIVALNPPRANDYRKVLDELSATA